MDNRKTVLLRKVKGGEAAQEKEHKGGAKAFMRKVFGIVAAQMTVTFAFALAGTVFKKDAGEGARHPAVEGLAILGLLASAWTISFGTDLRKKVP